MNFKITIENYAGIREYHSVEDFMVTLKNILSNCDESECLNFKVFGIKQDSKNIYYDKNYKRFARMSLNKGKDLIKAALEDKKVFTDALELKVLTKIARRTLNRYLLQLREKKPSWLIYKRIDRKWQYQIK